VAEASPGDPSTKFVLLDAPRLLALAGAAMHAGGGAGGGEAGPSGSGGAGAGAGAGAGTTAAAAPAPALAPPATGAQIVQMHCARPAPDGAGAAPLP
jgi:hypothetical protein